jgi:hypothetical protein
MADHITNSVENVCGLRVIAMIITVNNTLFFPRNIITYGQQHQKFLIILMRLGASGQGYPSSRNKNLGSFSGGYIKRVSLYIGGGSKKS